MHENAANIAVCRQNVSVLPYQIDHVIAQKHRSITASENLALSCFYCNSYKGPNSAGIDPVTNRISRLYNPRTDDWDAHFGWDSPVLVGRTRLARATIGVLCIKIILTPSRCELRCWMTGCHSNDS